MRTSDPAAFFQAACGHAPLPFQLVAIEQEPQPLSTLEAPTGLGKTLALLVSWLYHRQLDPHATPRRLVFQLPLRTLVDQIAAECQSVLDRLELAMPVCVLRGGQIEEDYLNALAGEAVIVGTLDQVISRQLMRGYCCSRWSWPRHFAALNTDVRVVVDETQLQGAAVRTAIRLQELHEKLGGPRPRQLVLVSATLDPALLPAGTPRHGLVEADYAHPVAQRKVGRSKPLTLAGSTDPIELVRRHHRQGTLSLVVVNTVRSAQAIYGGLAELPRLLLHSRFRRLDRQAIETQLAGFRGVVVATQTVEAGIDLDARLLVTELCPWASFVQRCGRVGRNDTYPDAQVLVVDPGIALPYEETELAATRQRLERLTDVGVRHLMAVAAPPQPAQGERLTEERFADLFDNHPLAQGDIDITPYVRVGDMRDVSLLWRDAISADMPGAIDRELCPVLLRATQQRFTTVWTPRGDGWIPIPSAQLRAGDVAAVQAAEGGYHPEQGWQPDSSAPVAPIPLTGTQPEPEDRSSFGTSVPVTLPQHLSDAQQEASEICSALQLPEPLAAQLIRSAWLHDIGKAHPVFQATMRANGCGEGQWAKAPGWGSRHQRVGFRHEVASALAAVQLGEDDLIAYMLMCHHGKVRLQLEPFPWQSPDDPLHGVIDGEQLPAIAGVSPATTLHHLPRGLGKSWRSRCGRLLRSFGPFQLAWLEAIVREADVRASRRWQTPSPLPPCT